MLAVALLTCQDPTGGRVGLSYDSNLAAFSSRSDTRQGKAYNDVELYDKSGSLFKAVNLLSILIGNNNEGNTIGKVSCFCVTLSLFCINRSESDAFIKFVDPLVSVEFLNNIIIMYSSCFRQICQGAENPTIISLKIHKKWADIIFLTVVY